MSSAKENIKPLVLNTQNVSNGTLPITNKKISRFLSRLLFSPVYLKQNKKQFFVDYMWLTTYKKLFSLEEKNSDKNNRDH